MSSCATLETLDSSQGRELKSKGLRGALGQSSSRGKQLSPAASLMPDLKCKAEAKEQKTGVTLLCLELRKEEAEALQHWSFDKRSRERVVLRMLQERKPLEKMPDASQRRGGLCCMQLSAQPQPRQITQALGTAEESPPASLSLSLWGEQGGKQEGRLDPSCP